MAGPKEQLPKGWGALKKHLDLGPVSGPGRHLGRDQSFTDAVLPDGSPIRPFAYGLSSFLGARVDKCLSLAGENTVLREAWTPFSGKGLEVSESRLPSSNDEKPCPWRQYCGKPSGDAVSRRARLWEKSATGWNQVRWHLWPLRCL
jgi:hypothetical protein